jgi:hypothetical protein
VNSVLNDESMVTAAGQASHPRGRQARKMSDSPVRNLAPMPVNQASPTGAAGANTQRGNTSTSARMQREPRRCVRSKDTNSRVQPLSADLISEHRLCKPADCLSGETLEDIVESDIVQDTAKVLRWHDNVARRCCNKSIKTARMGPINQLVAPCNPSNVSLVLFLNSHSSSLVG